MLSDRERATWQEMQDQFLVEDPGFVQAFDAPGDLPASTLPQPVAERLARRVLAWAAALIGLLLILTGAVGGALLIAMVGVALLLGRR